MEYGILKLNLRNKTWKKWYKRETLGEANAKKNIKPVYVSNDYAQHEDYGFYIDDDTNAYQHAIMTMEKIDKALANKWRWQRMKAYYRVLSVDFENYLQSIQNMMTGDYGETKWLFAQVARIGMNEKMVDLVCHYWREYRDTDGYGQPPLDFDDIYMACGDRALFEKRDIGLAIRFYELAKLDWWIPEEEEEREEKVIEEPEVGPEISLYKNINDGKAVEESEFNESAFDCEKCYSDFISLYEAELGSYDKLIEIANAFCEAYERVWNKQKLCEQTVNDLKMRHIYRMNFMMALQIYDKSMLPVLFKVSCESNEIRDSYTSIAEKEIRASKQMKLRPIKKYLTSPQRDGNTLWLLIQATGCTEQIKNLLLERNMEQNIAYYTSIDTLRFMLPEKSEEHCGKLAVMHMAYMNDPNEGKVLRKCVSRLEDPDAGKRVRKSVEYPYVFMKCFTSLIDDLPMWEMYGDHAKGCCIVLNKEYFKNNESGQQLPLYRICYLKKKGEEYILRKGDNPNILQLDVINCYIKMLQKVYDELKDNVWVLHIYFSILEQITYLFKNADYQHEQELRILYSYGEVSKDFLHTAGEFPKLFLRPDFCIQIEEIILGPKLEGVADKVPYLQEQIAQMCEITQTKIPELTRSEIEYR